MRTTPRRSLVSILARTSCICCGKYLTAEVGVIDTLRSLDSDSGHLC
jgi:hypothetical protein